MQTCNDYDRVKAELESLIAELEECIPGIQDAYDTNGAVGLARRVMTWAWEDAERALRKEMEE